VRARFRFRRKKALIGDFKKHWLDYVAPPDIWRVPCRSSRFEKSAKRRRFANKYQSLGRVERTKLTD
jgi:hypothetical protein